MVPFNGIDRSNLIDSCFFNRVSQVFGIEDDFIHRVVPAITLGIVSSSEEEVRLNILFHKLQH